MSDRRAWAIAGAITVAAAGVIAYTFDPVRAAQPSMLVAIGGFYVVAAALTLFDMRRRDVLRDELRFMKGDISMGALTAGTLYGLAMLGHLTLTARGTPREGWIVRLYLQVGPGALKGSLSEPDPGPLLGLAVGAIAALEEIVWRGLVQRRLEPSAGGRQALLGTSVLCAVAHLPTALLLRDPTAGYNPLIVMAAFGCSIVWGGLALRTKRLVPSILAHALFSWAIVEFPVWRP
jgi:membrane protease YdiL (CAAX protease family)